MSPSTRGKRRSRARKQRTQQESSTNALPRLNIGSLFDNEATPAEQKVPLTTSSAQQLDEDGQTQLITDHTAASQYDQATVENFDLTSHSETRKDSKRSLKKTGDEGRDHVKVRPHVGRGNHVRFEDDGTVSFVSHSFSALEGLQGRMENIIPSASSPAQGDNLSTKQDDHQQQGPSKVEEAAGQVKHEKSPTGPSFFESIGDDVSFAIMDFLADPLAAHGCATYPRDEAQWDQMFAYNTAGGVLDSLAAKHPFFQLAMTSKVLRDKVEAYCAHVVQRIIGSILPSGKERIAGKNIPENALAQRVARMNKQELKAKNLVDKSKVWRVNWINVAWRRCLFCGKATARRAIFQYMTWCCRKCDDQRWPKMKAKDVSRRHPVLRSIHLTHIGLVWKDAKTATVAFDRANQCYYYLKHEIEALEGRVKSEDPELEATEAAEKEREQQLKRMGDLSLDLHLGMGI